MPDRFDEIESRVNGLERQVRGITGRLERLEATASEPASFAAGATPHASALAEGLSPGTLALVGRTLVVLGGGYLIRAITDAGILPTPGGVVLGLAYAMAWLGMADRAAAAGRRASASVHGLTAGFIAFPLLWETTTRFRLLGPAAALALVVAVLGACLVVAHRRDLAPAAWATTGLALGTAAALFLSTRDLLAGVLALLAVAALVEWLAFRDRWAGLRWPAAAVLDAGLLIAVWLLSRRHGLPEGYPPTSLAAAVTAALAVPALFLTSIAARTLGRGRSVTPFEIVQGATALILGFGGAWRMLASRGASGAGLGGVSLLIGALCYAAAFAFVERRKGRGRNFYFYLTAGGLLTLVGSRLLLEPTPLAAAWCLLGLAACWLGRRFDRMTLRFHGALYVCAAAAAAGLVGGSWRHLFAPASGAWELPRPAGWITAASVIAAYVVLAGERARSAQWPERLPQGTVAAAAAWIVAGILIAELVVAVPKAASSPAVVASLRMAVLTAMVLALAWGARHWALPELAWLVYPLLAIGGLKLLLEDLPGGRPGTLFLSLALYGGALIAAPALLKRAP